MASLICSCGVFKKKSRAIDKHVAAVEVKQETVTANTETAKEQIQSKEVDKGKIITEEEEKIKRKKPATNSEFTVNGNELDKDGNFELLDSFGNAIVGKFDTVNQKLDLILKTAPVDEEIERKKRTEEYKDETKEGTGKKEEKKETETKQKNKEAVRQEDTTDVREEDTNESFVHGFIKLGIIGIVALFVYKLITYIIDTVRKPKIK